MADLIPQGRDISANYARQRQKAISLLIFIALRMLIIIVAREIFNYCGIISGSGEKFKSRLIANHPVN